MGHINLYNSAGDSLPILVEIINRYTLCPAILSPGIDPGDLVAHELNDLYFHFHCFYFQRIVNNLMSTRRDWFNIKIHLNNGIICIHKKTREIFTYGRGITSKIYIKLGGGE